MPKNILIVDDEDLLRKMLGLKLRSAGYEIAEARDGIEGVAMARELQPDLIFLDRMMPKMGGEEAFVQLQADPTTKDIPVIVMTARDEPRDPGRDAFTDAHEYLVKPVRLGAVMDIVNKVLDD